MANNPDKAHYRRIKRHVIGKEHLFFAAVSPGLEKICLDEFRTILPESNHVEPVSGGIVFKGSISHCYVANLNSRVANRILMRLFEFKATNFHQLHTKVSSFPWELYLASIKDLEFSITTQHSRLYHSGAVEEHIRRGISDRFVQSGSSRNGEPEIKIPHHIFVRAREDRFLISLDSSGDLLHKRGIQRSGAKAPIRETVAAGTLLLAGYDPSAPLLDPMCGSGTFSVEAALMARNIPAGWYRNFSFERWPSFKPRQWAYIRNRIGTDAMNDTQPSVFASDRDAVAVREFEKWLSETDYSDTIAVEKRDFFDVKPGTLTDRTGLVMINPPYGRRIGTGGDQVQFFKDLFEKLITDFAGWKLGLIIPRRQLVDLCPFKAKRHPIFHGGLNLTLLTGRIR